MEAKGHDAVGTQGSVRRYHVVGALGERYRGGMVHHLIVMLALPVGCRPADEGARPHVVGEVEVLPADDDAPLARAVRFTSDAAAAVTWTLTTEGHRIEQRFPVGTDHEHVLLGLRPERTYQSTLQLEGDEGSRVVSGPDITAGPLPSTFPQIEVLAWDPDEVEPGVTLINLTVPLDGGEEVTHVVLLDEALEPVWFLQSEANIGYVRWDGGLWGLSEGHGVHWTPQGTMDRRLIRQGAPTEPTEVDVALELDRSLHYDILPTDDDSFFSLVYDSFEVDEYPLSAEEPEVMPNPQTLRDMVVVEVGFDGALRNRWPMSERLDPGRISFSSHDPSRDGLDWAHSNAVAHDPDGGVLVSSRHQDAVVSLDEEGDVRWILSNPDGWREPWASLRLQPVGDVQWPSHQHAPHVSDDGVLVMFDNGNHRSTPYAPEEELAPTTRIVGYRVDAEAFTVEQVFSFEETVNGPLYSNALGDADPQPQTGNVLATYSMLDQDGDGRNIDAGRGRLTVRLIEFAPATLETVLDLRFATDGAQHPRGVRSFRADRVPSDALPWKASGPMGR